jgi:hypothetical protein
MQRRFGEAGLENCSSSSGQLEGAAFLQAMQQRLARQGLRLFVQDTVAPLTVQVGLAWEQGRLHVFEEHLFTELTARVLRQAIAAVPGGSEPRVLLTTLPKEPHGLGLLMVEAVLSLEGAQCISLGTQMPLLEIVDAAARTGSMSWLFRSRLPFPRGRFPRFWSNCARRCRDNRVVGRWRGRAQACSAEGVVCMASLDNAIAAVNRWRRPAT